jgi:hypothetical protein
MTVLAVNQRLLDQVRLYRTLAQTCYTQGKRDYFLPCEFVLGEHCSALFEKDLESLGYVLAIKRHIERCPKGKKAGLQGLLSGALLLTNIPLLQDSWTNMCREDIIGC